MQSGKRDQNGDERAAEGAYVVGHIGLARWV
jgi:hypothetical protein